MMISSAGTSPMKSPPDTTGVAAIADTVFIPLTTRPNAQYPAPALAVASKSRP
jgi:hypothetical protein